MSASKRERLNEIVHRLDDAAPCADAQSALALIKAVMRTVEDAMSGIPENPSAATSLPDGRMYPPHELFEKKSGHSMVQLFKQTGHSTWIGQNGAFRIQRSDEFVEIDKPGKDGKTISDLMSEEQ